MPDEEPEEENETESGHPKGESGPGSQAPEDVADVEPEVEAPDALAEEPSADEDGEPSGEAGPRPSLRAGPFGGMVLGELVLHYPSRDVVLAMDGASAMRIMTIYARRGRASLGDEIGPGSSPAHAWFVLDAEEALAMSWLPGLPARRPRTAIDPPPVRAA